MNGNGPAPGGTSAALVRAEHAEASGFVEREEQHLDQDKMVQWILDKSDPKHKRLQCESFLLFHDHKVQGLVCVSTGATIPKTKISPEEKLELVQQMVEEFAEESEARAQRFAPDLQGFQVSAYVKEGVEPEDKGADPNFTKYFNVTPAGSVSDPQYQGNSTGNGDVDAVQVIAGLQRDKETTLKELVRYIASSQDRIIDWNTSVMHENTTLRAQTFDQAMKMEALLDDRARRDAEAIEQKMLIDAKWQLIQGAMDVAKGLFHRYMALHPPPAPPPGPPQIGPDGQPAPQAAPAPGPGAADPLTELGKHLSPEELVGIVAVLSDANQDRFKQIAMPIVAHMEPARQQMVGQLLLRLQEQRAQERATAEAAKAGADIKVTMQSPAPSPSPAPTASKKGGKK